MFSTNDDQNKLSKELSAILFAVLFCASIVTVTLAVQLARDIPQGRFGQVEEIDLTPNVEVQFRYRLLNFYDRIVNTLHRESELLCLQKNIYFEARNQPLEGQIAVGLVTYNRVADWRYPDTFCGVVYDPYQFSWTHQGVDKPGFIRNNIDQQSWNTARNVSMMIYNNDVDNYLPSVLHYHADRVNPHWASSEFKRVFTQIGDHIFYQLKT
jgi:hypothetical protein